MYDVSLREMQNHASNAWLRLCEISGFGFRVSDVGVSAQSVALTTVRSRSDQGIAF